MHLIVTRPRAQAAAWVRELRSLGLQASALPLIEIAPAADPAPLREAWRTLPQCTLAMFVSANAVQHFFVAAEPGTPWPAGVLAGATGPGTAGALAGAGVPAALLVAPPADAPSFDSEALWAQLRDRDWRGCRVRVVRGDGGRDWFADTLRAQGATVDFVTAYRRLPPRPDAAGQALLAGALAAPRAHLWLFSSSEAVEQLRHLAPAADWSHAAALAAHPRIAAAARAAGFGRVEAMPPTPGAVAGWLHAGPRR